MNLVTKYSAILLALLLLTTGCNKEPQNGGNNEEEEQTTGQLNGHDWIDLGLPSGTLWATCNVGASTPESYGNYFAWGETIQQADNAFVWSSYKYANGDFDKLTKYCNQSNLGNNGYVDTQTILSSSDDAATTNWSAGWRTPTYDEFMELKDNCTIEEKVQNGVNGYLFSSSNGNSIFLPSAGICCNQEIFDAGDNAIYWSSNLFIEHSNAAWTFYFAPDNLYGAEGCDRCDGHPVRPVCSAIH